MWTRITYDYFCALGGLGGHVGQQGRLMTRNVYLGKHYHHTTYWIKEESCG